MNRRIRIRTCGGVRGREPKRLPPTRSPDSDACIASVRKSRLLLLSHNKLIKRKVMLPLCVPAPLRLCVESFTSFLVVALQISLKNAKLKTEESLKFQL
jgi:hypothetical protein